MATNNLLVNNEQKVLYDVRKRVERSGHNLSQSRKFPARVGYIYPFFCRKTLPSDSFKISANILIKQLQPLLVPQMVSFTVNTAFYWVDYSLAFPEFEYFLINQKGQQNIELPYVHLRTYFDNGNNKLLPELSLSMSDRNGKSAIPLYVNLRTFLDITKNASNEKVDALPFWAYRTIIRDFYTNVDRLSDDEYQRLFPSNYSDHFLKQGENLFYNNNNATDFDYISVHNVRGDYFVNSYPTPLRGDVPELQITNSPTDLSATALFTGLTNQDTGPSLNLDNTRLYFKQADGVTINSAPTLRASSSDLGVYMKDPNADANYVNKMSASAQYHDNSLFRVAQYAVQVKDYLQSPHNYRGNLSLSNLSGLNLSLSVTSRQLRLLESLTRKREIDILMKPRLKNYLQTYFGVNRYKDDSLYQPVFIGSTTQQILINDIAQTTSTSDSPLGRQGATAMSLGSGYVGEYYCRNYGCLMGVMYILPDYDYEPALPREWSERTPDDFYNPEFAHLSMQAILNKEMFVSNDDNWNNEVLGYGGIYDNYRTSTNLVCGELLDDSFTDVKQFAQVRRFDNDNKPEITSEFLKSSTAFDSSVFSVPNLPPVIAQCVARVEAVRPLPEIATPRDS